MGLGRLMLTDTGYFDPTWLARQTIERLRYEARCEHVHNWQWLSHNNLLLILGQLRICRF